MPKYLTNLSYSQSGLAGLRKEGAVARRSFIEQLVAGMGGKVEAFYFAFGESDVVVVTDMPNNVDAAAFALAVAASGVGDITTTPLLAPEEVDAAMSREVGYRPPGA